MVFLLKILLTIPLFLIDILHCFVGAFLSFVFWDDKYYKCTISVLSYGKVKENKSQSVYDWDFLYWTTLLWNLGKRETILRLYGEKDKGISIK